MKQHILPLSQQFHSLRTPAFIIDEDQLLADAELAARLISSKNTRLLFAIKSFSIMRALQSLAKVIDGFHASSLFEAQLARDILGTSGLIHITSPGLRPDEFQTLDELGDYISFNSLSQWQAFSETRSGRGKYGLRINPHLSLVDDVRYDPCRRYSKLGISLEQLQAVASDSPARLEGISGLQLHTNCDSTDWGELLMTVEHLAAHLQKLLEKLEWINLGGGYLFATASQVEKLQKTIEILTRHYGLCVFFEPGAAISRRAGYFISKVLDIFDGDGMPIAILDTTVNHMPEVFEFQFRPDIVGSNPGGSYHYLIAGSTCLAGDLFGRYTFPEPLHIGSCVAFENAGAYTMVKAHMFNGVNLPDIYIMKNGDFSLIKRFSYNEYLTQCGGR